MATAESMLEKDSCVICLQNEEESTKLNNNDKCSCRYSYHDECMKNILICPYCKIHFATVTIPVAPIQQVHQNQYMDRADSCIFKFVFFVMVIAGLTVIGYFTAISS
jgi:hypothetical protein